MIMAFGYVEAQTSYIPYYTKTIDAFTKMAENNYVQAVECYEEAFSNYYPFPEDLANLRDCYLAMGDTASAVNCVERMIACGWQLRETYPVMDVTPMENRIGSFDSVRIAHITAIYPALRQKYLQQIDPALNAYLERIVLNEIFCQEVRDGVFGEERWTNVLFAQNAADLCELLKNKELDREHVDVWNNQLLLIALVHCAKALGLKEYARERLYTEMMELLKQEVLKGNLYPDVYASVYDIVYWFNYGKSYYGRQLSFDPETGKHRCVEIEDTATVDKRRAEIGLPPIWAFCKKYNITPPANY
jgi:tetratricopeptide (TPR) repeat protein